MESGDVDRPLCTAVQAVSLGDPAQNPLESGPETLADASPGTVILIPAEELRQAALRCIDDMEVATLVGKTVLAVRFDIRNGNSFGGFLLDAVDLNPELLSPERSSADPALVVRCSCEALSYALLGYYSLLELYGWAGVVDPDFGVLEPGQLYEWWEVNFSSGCTPSSESVLISFRQWVEGLDVVSLRMGCGHWFDDFFVEEVAKDVRDQVVRL